MPATMPTTTAAAARIVVASLSAAKPLAAKPGPPLRADALRMAP
ncbi:MAG: hypothetical protein U1F11_04165 [Steroidobacteraceae bacterium]